MQLSVQRRMIAQPRSNEISTTTSDAISTTTLSTPDYISLFALMCLPLIVFSSISGKKVYQKHRAKVLKQQIMKLESVWHASYQPEQDS